MMLTHVMAGGPGPGSGGPVGPGVRVGGIEVGARRAPRLLVTYIW